jgi:glycerophosphoryl diester phosphodiesterase
VSAKHPYLSPAKPRVLAHRGLAVDAGVDENTFSAFESAVRAGVSYVESDIQVTSDGIAVLFHDDDLARVAGLAKRIDQLTLFELSEVKLSQGGSVPTLEETLLKFETLNFNLDVKVWGAIDPAAEVINRLGVHDRVLVSAFSDRRRRAALRRLSKPVASSAGSGLVIALYLASRLGLIGLMRAISKNADAVQVPIRSGPLRFDSPSFISRAQRAGLEVHFWTINEVTEIKRLVELGADGIVTDRADLALTFLQK